MLKRLKLKSITIACMMLLFIGFSLGEAMAQTPQLCPQRPFSTGILSLDSNPAPTANFAAALLATAEFNGGDVTGGIDWMYSSFLGVINIGGFETVIGSLLNTSITGSQVVSWFSQADGRNTNIQVSNTARGQCLFGGANFTGSPLECGDVTDCLQATGENTCLDLIGADGVADTCEFSGEACTVDADCTPQACGSALVAVHVEILGEDCQEIIDFCDAFTPLDTHVYDLGNLVRNIGGAVAGASILNGREGTFVLTPVTSCPANNAIAFNHLAGNLRIIDSRLDVDFGTNVYTRLADSLGCLTLDTNGQGGNIFDGSNVLDGSLACQHVTYFPDRLVKDFNTVGGAPAGADVVFIALLDSYDPFDNEYSVNSSLLPTPFVSYQPAVFDAAEQFISCPDVNVCFARVGIDAPLPSIDDIVIPTPTPAPTATPVPPTPTPVPPTPTPNPGGGGGGGCAIAAEPTGFGTTMANILITLIPAAVIGLRAVRRRRK